MQTELFILLIETLALKETVFWAGQNIGLSEVCALPLGVADGT